jgi:4-hydroxybutyryl-CoA dehydratase / vinylacetyl-CoA-Delta-isomerase
MNAPEPQALAVAALMSGDGFRESLRRYKPRVFLDGRQVASVVDERGFAPGINAIALTYDYARQAKYAPIMTALQHTSGKLVNRLSHINTSSAVMMGAYFAWRA